MQEEEALLEAVMAASRAMVGMAAVAMERLPIEVTLTQYRALVVLSTVGPMRMSDVANALELSPSSATRLVERLERKDLVVRRTSPESRRSVELALLPRGEALVAQSKEERRRQVRALLANVSPKEREAISRAFERFAELAGEPIEVAAPLAHGARATV